MLCVRMRGRRSIQRHHQIKRARAIKRQVAAARGVTTLHIGDLSSFLRLRVRGGPSSRLPRSSLYRHRNVPRRLSRRLLSISSPGSCGCALHEGSSVGSATSGASTCMASKHCRVPVVHRSVSMSVAQQAYDLVPEMHRLGLQS